MNALTKIEPIQAIVARRPASIPSLPQWAERLTSAARQELQPAVVKGRETFAEQMTLPPDLIPTPAQRTEMEAHKASLRSYLAQTPEKSEQAETMMAAAITKLLLVLPSMKRADIGEEARTEVYLEVLDDVPHWAVSAAITRWHRHNAGNDERGRPHDYKWAPDPGTLRQVALRETYPMHERIDAFDRVLVAKPYVDCSEQFEKGRHAFRAVMHHIGDPEKLKALTFEQAADIGKALPPLKTENA